ncbi:MAG: hypothetical protein NTY35_01670 [Planctomycetota bacterium]|nr:hypothetical protein [Planctomycetota bacterium]
MRSHSSRRILYGAAFTLTLIAGHVAAQVGTTVRASTAADGSQTDGFVHSINPAISDDGRYVAFESAATTFVLGDTNNRVDIFVKDLATGAIERVSVSSTGVQSNGNSYSAKISSDGRFVAFKSDGNTLVPGYFGIYVRDRLLGTTQCATVAFDGSPLGGAVEPDFGMSSDGRYVGFSSGATNAAPGPDANGTTQDVYVRDLLLGTSERISVTTAGAQGSSLSTQAAISRNGRWVAFRSSAILDPPESNGLVGDIYVRDRQLGTTRLVSSSSAGVLPNAPCSYPAISDDGRWVAFHSDSDLLVPGDTNVFLDVFVKDVQTGTLICVTSASSGGPPLGGAWPGLSADGRFATFVSAVPTYVPGDTNGRNDLFVRDLVTGVLTRVHVASGGGQANENVMAYSLARSGTCVAFESQATNLVPGDTNTARDVFVHQRPGPTATSYCTAKVDSVGCLPVFQVTGTPSVGNGQGFDVALVNVRSNTVGQLFYGLAPQALPFAGGTLCASGSLRRTPLRASGGPTPPLDCTGSFTFDFAAHAASGVDAALVPGTTVYAQYTYRDPLDPSGFGRGLSGGTAFTLVP